MAETQAVKNRGKGAVEKVGTENVQSVRPPETETIFVPQVDIRVGKEDVTLTADMPGVDVESVRVTVNNSVLTIEGRAVAQVPDGYRLVGQEYGVGQYRRDFTLADTVNTDGIKARVRNGVLTLTLPKQETAKTRKVPIES